MRLTGGLDRGRRLKAPKGLGTRPTAAKVREAIFNILGPPPDGSALDLFAGTGALGLEALSRGATRAIFVERDRTALASLRQNLRELNLTERATVMGTDTTTALRRLAASLGKDERFGWVFIDPPYALPTDAILAELCDKALLHPWAVIVVEHDRKHRPPASVGCLFRTDHRTYGDTELSFYRAGCS
jgi:16S rRNA (guanine966-N2)-methyltransferase